MAQTERRALTAPHRPGPPSRATQPGRIVRWAPVAAVTWSVAYLAMGVSWLTGADGYPWQSPGSGSIAVSVMDQFSDQTGAWLVTAVSAGALALAVVSMLLARRPGTGAVLRVTAGTGLALGVLLAVVVPDFRLLAGLGYTPILVLGWIIGFGRDISPAEAYPWPWVNLLLITLGGLSFVAAGIGWRRVATQTRGQVASRMHGSGRPSPGRIARRGCLAVIVSVLIPVGYAITRFAWALGIPLGLTDESLEAVRPIAGYGAGLGAFAVVGALLTLGLVRPWGEAFPRWVPRWAGRRVPVALAVVPASVVSVAVTSAGLMFVRLALFDGFGDAFPVGRQDVAGWLPEMFWPLWGVALGVATHAYWLRRRGGVGSEQ